MSKQKERMLNGKIYDSCDSELIELRIKCHRLCREYNSLDDTSLRRKEILKELGIKMGEGVYLQGPIYFDYGCFISIGEHSYANFNFTVLDICPVNIGKNVFIGTGVSLVTALHPLRYQERNCYVRKDGRLTDDEYGKPITIEDDCWIASNVTVIGGVTIGKGSVIGAGSVVTKNIPPNSLAVGNPCRVIREITEKDKVDKSLYE